MSDSETEAARGDAPDPERLTRLASEQTYLAWSRTALSAFGLSIAIGGVLPAITNGSDWLLILLGAAFGLLGVSLLAHGLSDTKLSSAQLIGVSACHRIGLKDGPSRSPA